MKVNHINMKGNEIHMVSHSEDKESTSRKDISFRNQLNHNTRSNKLEFFYALAGEISMQGEIICKRCDIKELKRYKELISNFLQETIKNSYEFDKQSEFDKTGKYRMNTRIKKINEKLEVLTNEILKEQADPVEILKNVEDIKGLILDILL